MTVLKLRNIVRHRNPDLFPVFCLIRDRVGSVIPGMGKLTAWLFCTGPRRIDAIEIDKDLAMQIKDICGLKEVLRDNRGGIYDTPDGAFRQKFRGHHVEDGIGNS